MNQLMLDFANSFKLFFDYHFQKTENQIRENCLTYDSTFSYLFEGYLVIQKADDSIAIHSTDDASLTNEELDSLSKRIKQYKGQMKSSYSGKDVSSLLSLYQGVLMMPKRLFVYSGVNGAGKSTISRGLSELPGLSHVFGEYLNPDLMDIKKFGNELYSKISDGLTISTETATGSQSTRSMPLARQGGYLVINIVVGLDYEELHIQRVKERVATGGHDIPKADILRRFNKLGNDKNCDQIRISHATIFIDNSAKFGPQVCMVISENLADGILLPTPQPKIIHEVLNDHEMPKWVKTCRDAWLQNEVKNWTRD